MPIYKGVKVKEKQQGGMKYPVTGKSRRLLPPLDQMEQRKEQEVAGNQKVPAVGESYLTGAVAFSRGSMAQRTCPVT